jgi:hypothetical protein
VEHVLCSVERVLEHCCAYLACEHVAVHEADLDASLCYAWWAVKCPYGFRLIKRRPILPLERDVDRDELRDHRCVAQADVWNIDEDLVQGVG